MHVEDELKQKGGEARRLFGQEKNVGCLTKNWRSRMMLEVKVVFEVMRLAAGVAEQLNDWWWRSGC